MKNPKLEKIKTQGVARSDKWPAFKKTFAKTHPQICTVCGSKVKVELHHIAPFHLNQDKELDPNNVIWLCESEKYLNCHLWYGHLGSFKSWNVDVATDAPLWNKKFLNRPK